VEQKRLQAEAARNARLEQVEYKRKQLAQEKLAQQEERKRKAQEAAAKKQVKGKQREFVREADVRGSVFEATKSRVKTNIPPSNKTIPTPGAHPATKAKAVKSWLDKIEQMDSNMRKVLW
jgi:hypothetical protein